jgi:hypothetical protein
MTMAATTPADIPLSDAMAEPLLSARESTGEDVQEEAVRFMLLVKKKRSEKQCE